MIFSVTLSSLASLASLSQRSFVGLPTMAHYSKVGLDTQVALRPEAEHCTCVSR